MTIRRRKPQTLLCTGMVQVLEDCCAEFRNDLAYIFGRAAVVGECWEWTGAKNDKGYGRFETSNGQLVYVHRFSLAARGADLREHQACHHCDNPSCIRPDHLFAGKNIDNVRDCIAKGRAVSHGRRDWPTIVQAGEHHWQRLTIEEVKIVKSELAAGRKQADIARAYGISTQHVSQIANGKRWAHL